MARRTDYGPIASNFDRRYRDYDYTGVETALRAFIASQTHVIALDAGCGTAHWLKQLGSPERRLIGLDQSSAMLSQATRKGEFELVRAEAEALPFRTGSFDRIFCVNALHHFTNKFAFVTEARRALRRGGGLMIVSLDPHTGLDKWWIYDYFEGALELDRRRYFSCDAIREMLAASGFVNCRSEVVRNIPAVVSARRSLERGELARTATSQLAILTDDEYHAGLQRIQADIEDAERQGQELLLISDLRLFATTAWLG